MWAEGFRRRRGLRYGQRVVLHFSAVAVLALVPSALADPAPAWQFDRFTDGMRVDVREVKGSSFEEVRVMTNSALPLKALIDRLQRELREGF